MAGRVGRFRTGAAVAAVCWPAALPAQDTISVVVDTAVTGSITVDQLTITRTITILDTVHVPPPDTTPPPAQGARVVASDDTTATIETTWLGHPDAVSYDNFAERAGALIELVSPATSPSQIVVQLVQAPSQVAVSVNGKRADGSIIPRTDIVLDTVTVPARTGAVVPPDTMPPDTTPPQPPPGGSANILDIPADAAEAGPNEPAGMTPIGYSRFDSKGACAPESATSSREKCALPQGGVHFYGRDGALADHTSRGWLRLRMPVGCMGNQGTSCGNMLTHAMAASPAQPDTRATLEWREMYLAFRMRVDGDYWVNPAGNKVATPMWMNPSGGENGLGWIRLKGTTDRWPGQRLKDAPTPVMWQWSYGDALCGQTVNNISSIPVQPDTDHLVEFHIRAGTGPCTTDGEISLWIDGQLARRLVNVATWDGRSGNNGGGTAFWGLKIQHILGGVCSNQPCPTSVMFIEHDGLYLSGR